MKCHHKCPCDIACISMQESAQAKTETEYTHRVERIAIYVCVMYTQNCTMPVHRNRIGLCPANSTIILEYHSPTCWIFALSIYNLCLGRTRNFSDLRTVRFPMTIGSSGTTFSSEWFSLSKLVVFVGEMSGIFRDWPDTSSCIWLTSSVACQILTVMYCDHPVGIVPTLFHFKVKYHGKSQ